MTFNLIFAFIFLFGSFMLTLKMRFLELKGRFALEEIILKGPYLFFFERIFFLKKTKDNKVSEVLFRKFLFFLSTSRKLTLFLYLFFALSELRNLNILTAKYLITLFLIPPFFQFATGFTSRKFLYSTRVFHVLFSSFFSVILLPITIPLSILEEKGNILKKRKKEPKESRFKEKIFSLIEDLTDELAYEERKLLQSLPAFHEKSASAIMVPKIKIFALDSSLTIKESVEKIVDEGFSRVPVYTTSLDQMEGILFAKDVLAVFAGHEKKWNLDDTLLSAKGLLRPVFYTPETRKIAPLLQEFRAKQSLLAVVVDEYGATSGLITIEDVIEELVGEIKDEHDEKEARLYTELPNGSYLIDCRMEVTELSALLSMDIEKADLATTVGGWITELAGGVIPEKNKALFLEKMKIKIIESDSRSVKKILLTKDHETV